MALTSVYRLSLFLPPSFLNTPYTLDSLCHALFKGGIPVYSHFLVSPKPLALSDKNKLSRRICSDKERRANAAKIRRKRCTRLHERNVTPVEQTSTYKHKDITHIAKDGDITYSPCVCLGSKAFSHRGIVITSVI